MRKIYTLVLFLIVFVNGYSQVKEEEVITRNVNGQPKLINLTTTDVTSDSIAVEIFIKSLYKSDERSDFKIQEVLESDSTELKAIKFQQYYQGIKVEFGQINAVTEYGKLKTVNGNYLDIAELSATPVLSEEQALESALHSINAKEYAWNNVEMETLVQQEDNNPNATNFPTGELVIVESDFNSKTSIPLLAYKFGIYATQPLSRANYYVDAKDGKILLVDNILKDFFPTESIVNKPRFKHTDVKSSNSANLSFVAGTAATRYSGTRTIETSLSGSQYRLRDNTRGNGIHTRNMNSGSSYTGATDLLDSNNNWTAAEYNNASFNNALLDAHWGAMNTYTYFLTRHGRVGINGSGLEIKNYVNANLIGLGYANNFNAFWDGAASRITYGIGNNNPLTTLDIVAHEIGHGLNDFTANLIYQRESGALDEGLSDIWGSMVEFYAAPEKQTYNIGEDLGAISRSMSDPKTRFQPDTFGGINWQNPNCANPSNANDYCSVHTNSGILNHWFYLLAEGTAASDRINDNGGRFNFLGIGKINAAKIVYRAETVYFTANMTYADARALTIQAARDLFGTTSTQAVITNNAWFAVGIGNLISGQITGADCACSSPNATFNITNFTDVTQVPAWQVSTNLQIVSSNNTSITVKSTSSGIRAAGFIRATFAGQQIQKDIWVGAPDTPTILNGPSSVAYGALANYNGQIINGASSYKWYLPYPYNQNATVSTNPTQWGIISGGTAINLHSQSGPNNGLVQFMGVNSCGTGGAKTMSVTVTGGSGGVPLMARFFPNTEGGNGIEVYPNPAKDLLSVRLNSELKADVILYNMNGIAILSEKNIINEIDINVSSMPTGLYFLQVTGEYNMIKKVMISR